MARVYELTGVLLDYWVAMAEGLGDATHTYTNGMAVSLLSPVNNRSQYVSLDKAHTLYNRATGKYYAPSLIWDQAGPIIEQNLINVWHNGHEWSASSRGLCHLMQGASTPLVAAMRFYVAKKYGIEHQDYKT